MGRFGLSSSEDSDDEVVIYPQDDGDETSSSTDHPRRTLRRGSRRALTTFMHPIGAEAVVVEQHTFDRDTIRRNENYYFSIRGNNAYYDHDHHGQLYNYIQNRRGDEGSRNKKHFYWKQCGFLLLLMVIQHYLPPPPPPVDSWGEYISHSTQGMKSTIANLMALTIYIVTGCLRNINQDLGMVIRSSILFRQSKTTTSISDECIPCPLKVPINIESYDESVEWIRNILQDHTVGQITAIDILSKALAKWNTSLPKMMHGPSHEELDEDEDTNRDENDKPRKRPLNMIFAGSDGVGKYQVAKQVAELLIHECQPNCKDPSSVGFHEDQNRILRLQGINFALNDESGAKSLIRQILSHVHKYANEGVVVIIRHVEDLGHAAKQELIRLLGKQSVSFLVDDDIGSAMVNGVSVANSKLLESFLFGEEKKLSVPTRKEVVVRLDNCIFLLTTDLGTDKIFRGLRNSAHESTGRLLEQGVTHELEEEILGFFGVNFEIFDAIVPFWPLQYVEVKDIMKYKVNKRSSRYKIELLDSALDYLAGPRNIEYMELKMIGPGDSGSFIFASRGGHDLVHEPIIKFIEEKLEADVFHHNDEVTRIGYIGDDKWTVEVCDREGVFCINKGTFQLDILQ